MPDKADLHRMADALPDTAVANAYRMIEQLSYTREQLHGAIDTLPEAAVESAARMLEMMARPPMGGGFGIGGGGVGSRMPLNPDEPRHQLTGQTQRGNEIRTSSVFSYRKQQIHCEERWVVAADGQSVTYDQEIKALRRQIEREVVIPLQSAPAAE